MNRPLKSLLAMLVVAGSTQVALAENPRVNVQVFRPSPHYGDLFTVMSTDIGDHLRWSAALMLDFAKNPLVFVDTSGATDVRQEVVQSQLTADLMGSIALFDRLSVGLAVPLFLLNDGETDGFVTVDPKPSSFALGDIRISPKVAILGRAEDENGFRVGAELGINLPTGDADSFVSDGFLLQPTILADFRSGPVLIALNLGYRVRLDDQEFAFDVKVGNEFIWRVGASYDVLPEQLQVIGEVYGASSDYSTANNTHVEGVIGGRYFLEDTGLAFTLGGGSGFTKGYGNTKFRIFAGVTFSPEVNKDQDLDGILDEFDQCPVEPEDMDKFQDEDGCPEDDNDADGIKDNADRCPNDPEDKDGFQDEDGCPDPDNDGDGIPDAVDQCPDEAEALDGLLDDDGCVDVDADGDGFYDSEDACPEEPENYDGKDDDDGCPD